MSFLSNQLVALCEQYGLKQSAIAKTTGFPNSHISRIFSGKQVYVSDDDLDRIVAAVARSPEDKAKIIRARLRDAYKGQFADSIKLILKPGGSKDDKRQLSVDLDPKIKRALEFLASSVPSSPALGRSLMELAEALKCREKRVS